MTEINNKNSFYFRFAITYLIFPMIPVTLVLTIILLISYIVKGVTGDDVLSIVLTFFMLNIIWFLLLLLFGLIIKRLQYYKVDTSKILIASYPIGKEYIVQYDNIKEITIKKYFLLTKVCIIADKNIKLCFSTKEDANIFLKESGLDSYLTK